MEKSLPKKKYYENVANTIIKNMEKRQIEGYYCPDSASALKKALELIPKGSSIGWGGSMTLTETGLMDAIQNGDYKIINRELAKTPEEQRKIYGEICCTDYFLMSTNAITLDGELINIDGRGNRVSFLCYGPQNVLILTGINKIVTDIDAGLKRARDIAAPPNTVRLNRKTPCAITGKCENCYSPDCICSQFVVTRRSGVPNRIKVIIIGEELGY
ncbi:MAG: lactate utilization protein [Clostridiales bacterium]|nr:lactate utilization protein [Clostridiales bacterium]